MMSDIPPKVALNLHIPLELCREILSRIPVKSLVRFRCVSKPWLSLISDPGFCRLHLKNFKNNRDETHLLVVQDRPKDWVVRCSKSLQSCASILPFLGCRLSEGRWNIKCCIDGLVLLNITYSSGSGREDQLVLWNPSIRKFHDIPSSPEIETNADTSIEKAEICLGIGYDPLVKDYKYVKLIRTDPNIPPLVAVYTVGAGSWKIIPFQGNGFSDFVWVFCILCEGVCLQGNLYFLVFHQEMSVLELVSYDLSSEVFSSFSLPDDAAYVDERYGVPSTELVRYGPSSLALFEYEDSTSMWVWESESMCWTQPYSIYMVMSKFLYLNKNSDILMWWREKVSFKLGIREKIKHWCGFVSSYNLETRKQKIMLMLPLERNCLFEMSEAYGYIESLVLLK